MGQKVNPIGFRLGQQFGWKSRWFADGKMYKDYLLEDVKIRRFLMDKLARAGIANVEIERMIGRIHLRLFVSRPGIVIGRGGTGLEELKKYLASKLKIASPAQLKVDVEEVKNPDLNAYLVASWAAGQLARRMPHRRVMNQIIERVIAAGAKGVKVMLSGRVAGAEISRSEQLAKGVISLQTLRKKIDFAHVPALTKYGYIGVKVWINTGK